MKIWWSQFFVFSLCAAAAAAAAVMHDKRKTTPTTTTPTTTTPNEPRMTTTPEAEAADGDHSPMMDFDVLTLLNQKRTRGSRTSNSDRILALEDQEDCGVCSLGTNIICPHCGYEFPFNPPINVSCSMAESTLQTTGFNNVPCETIRIARPLLESICGCETPLPISTLRLKTEKTTPPFVENEHDDLAGYVPMTPVADTNALVFDYMAIHAQLVNRHRLDNAMALYERGGNSGSYAELDLDGAGSPLSQNIPKGTTILGFTQDDGEGMVRGVVLDDAIAGDNQIRVLYDSSKCWVGALAKIGQAVTDGCFRNMGSVVVQLEGGLELNLTYSNLRNLNSRTLKGLSLQSGAMLEPSVFPNYVTYLGAGNENYADRIIQDAFSGTGHFSGSTIESRAMFLDRGIVTLEIWMAVVAEMENALRSCRSVVDDSGGSDENVVEGWDSVVASWDRAVSYYVGSPPKPSQNSGDRSRGQGGLLYLVADLFCGIFSTCLVEEEGTNGSAMTLVALTNRHVIAEFSAGQSSLMEGDCNAAQQSKDTIVNKMKIPLIQGAIFYSNTRWYYDEPYLERITGLAFIIPLIPLLAECNTSDADWLEWAMMASTVPPTNFRWILEKNYKCMGVTCNDIGGYLPTGDPPCSDEHDHYPTLPKATPSWPSYLPPSNVPIASPTYPWSSYTPYPSSEPSFQGRIIPFKVGGSQKRPFLTGKIWFFVPFAYLVVFYNVIKWSLRDAAAENEPNTPAGTTSSTDDAAHQGGADAATLQPQQQQPPTSNDQKLLRLKVLGSMFPEQTVTKTIMQYDSEATTYRWINHKTGDEDENDDNEQHKDFGGATLSGDMPGGGSSSKRGSVSNGKMTEKASINKKKTKTMCSICLDHFMEGDAIVFGACFHAFHRKCMMDWVLTNDGCPVCRQTMWDQDTYQDLIEEERQRSILHKAEPDQWC